MFDYAAYLRSPHWQALRRVKLWEQPYCEKCGRLDCIREVHHLTYVRLHHERLDDLMVLCSSCHEKHHFYGMSLALTEDERRRRDRLVSAQIYGTALCAGDPEDDDHPTAFEDDFLTELRRCRETPDARGRRVRWIVNHQTGEVI